MKSKSVRHAKRTGKAQKVNAFFVNLVIFGKLFSFTASPLLLGTSQFSAELSVLI